jgi:hypothetical protein
MMLLRMDMYKSLTRGYLPDQFKVKRIQERRATSVQKRWRALKSPFVNTKTLAFRLFEPLTHSQSMGSGFIKKAVDNDT